MRRFAPRSKTWPYTQRCPGQATCTERAKGVIHSDAVGARVGDNHVWVGQRSERWPSSQSSKYQGGESEYVTKHTTAKTQAKES